MAQPRGLRPLAETLKGSAMQTLSEHVRARVNCPARLAGEPCPDCDDIQRLLVAAEAFMPTEAEMRAFYQKVRTEGTDEQPMDPAFVTALEAAKRLMTAAMFIARYLTTEPDGTAFYDRAALDFVSRMIKSSLVYTRMPALFMNMHMEQEIPPPQGHA